MSTTVTDGGWTAHFGIPTILYGPGSLEEAHSVDDCSSDASIFSSTLCASSKLPGPYKIVGIPKCAVQPMITLRNKIVYKNKGNGHERPLPILYVISLENDEYVSLKKRSAQPSGMPVVSKRRANWMKRIRRSLKK
jgi:hypothetical protein